MPIKSFLGESRAFVVGRISAGATYFSGGLTVAGGAAKAATDTGVVPSWFPSITVDTMGIVIGALFTILTGMVSIWAKRKDTRLKEKNDKRMHAEWIMRMVRENGETEMVREFGKDWRRVAWQAKTTGLAALE